MNQATNHHPTGTRETLEHDDPGPLLVATAKDVRAAGVSRSTLERRCRAGRWQRLLPGVLLLSGTAPARTHLVRAALLYAGPSAVITGSDAMAATVTDFAKPAGASRNPGELSPGTRPVHLLVPAERRVSSNGLVLVERTTRMPEPCRIGGVSYAPAVRATLDLARRLTDRRRLAALLTHAISSGGYPAALLRTELDAGSQRGSAAPRAVLTDLERGLYAADRHRARRIVAASGLPQPSWAAPVNDGRGRPLGSVDAYWESIGLAWDFGGLDALGAGSSEALARRRDSLLAARGVLVLRTRHHRLRHDPRGLRDTLTATFRRAGLDGTRPGT